MSADYLFHYGAEDGEFTPFESSEDYINDREKIIFEAASYYAKDDDKNVRDFDYRVEVSGYIADLDGNVIIDNVGFIYEKAVRINGKKYGEY